MTAGAVVAAVSAFSSSRLAEDRYCYVQRDDLSAIENGPYDGRFTFFRVRFDPFCGGQRLSASESTRNGITTRRVPSAIS